MGLVWVELVVRDKRKEVIVEKMLDAMWIGWMWDVDVDVERR